MLDIDPMLLLISAEVFLMLLTILNKILFKPLSYHMQIRDEEIQSQLKILKNNDQKVELIKKEANDMLFEAKMKSKSIRDVAIEKANKKANKLISSAKADENSRYEVFLSTLEVQMQKLHYSLKDERDNYLKQINQKVTSI